jgi:hypothetical protein
MNTEAINSLNLFVSDCVAARRLDILPKLIIRFGSITFLLSLAIGDHCSCDTGI